MKKNTLLIIGGVIVAYYLWKKSQEETTSDFSNIGGRRRRRKYDKAQDKILAYCRRHPESPQCIGLDWGQGTQGGNLPTP